MPRQFTMTLSPRRIVDWASSESASVVSEAMSSSKKLSVDTLRQTDRCN